MKIEEIIKFKLSKLLPSEKYTQVTDKDIEYVLARAKMQIQSYCHRTDIPKGMYYLWADMAIEHLKVIDKTLFQIDVTSEEELNKRITSVKAGDTTINIDSTDDTIDTGYEPNAVDKNILNSFVSQLQSWRKVSAGCGKEFHGC